MSPPSLSSLLSDPFHPSAPAQSPLAYPTLLPSWSTLPTLPDPAGVTYTRSDMSENESTSTSTSTSTRSASGPDEERERKRQRNTDASRRFRINKKVKEETLALHAKRLESQVSTLRADKAALEMQVRVLLLALRGNSSGGARDGLGAGIGNGIGSGAVSGLESGLGGDVGQRLGLGLGSASWASVRGSSASSCSESD